LTTDFFRLYYGDKTAWHGLHGYGFEERRSFFLRNFLSCGILLAINGVGCCVYSGDFGFMPVIRDVQFAVVEKYL
jgi:hypothetical protein